jgi:hypothetical protein
MMHRTLPAAALAALLALGACNQSEPEVVDSRAPDPNAAQLNAAAPVALPPSIEATVTFRCKDNSLVYVDFFKGKELANLRLEKGGEPIALKADAAGNPYVGGGYTLTGNAQAIDLAGPNGAKACKA